MNDYIQRFCIYCQNKHHPEVQPDGTVVQVTVPRDCSRCVAWGDPRRWCEHNCDWLDEETRDVE